MISAIRRLMPTKDLMYNVYIYKVFIHIWGMYVCDRVSSGMGMSWYKLGYFLLGYGLFTAILGYFNILHWF